MKKRKTENKKVQTKCIFRKNFTASAPASPDFIFSICRSVGNIIVLLHAEVSLLSFVYITHVTHLYTHKKLCRLYPQTLLRKEKLPKHVLLTTVIVNMSFVFIGFLHGLKPKHHKGINAREWYSMYVL